MKKGVVLLITLLFITAISVLIFNNIKNTDEMLKQLNNHHTNTQVLLSIENYKQEIGKLLIKNKDNIDIMLNSSLFSNAIPLNIASIESSIYLKEYKDIYDVNYIFSSDPKDKQDLEKLFLENELDLDKFIYFVNDYLALIHEDIKYIDNEKQLTMIIDAFIQQQFGNKTYTIRDHLSVYNINSKSKLVLCKLTFDIEEKQYTSRFIYDLNEISEKEIKVKDFEISFK